MSAEGRAAEAVSRPPSPSSVPPSLLRPGSRPSSRERARNFVKKSVQSAVSTPAVGRSINFAKKVADGVQSAPPVGRSINFAKRAAEKAGAAAGGVNLDVFVAPVLLQEIANNRPGWKALCFSSRYTFVRESFIYFLFVGCLATAVFFGIGSEFTWGDHYAKELLERYLFRCEFQLPHMKKTLEEVSNVQVQEQQHLILV
jgi:hypothetical protein